MVEVENRLHVIFWEDQPSPPDLQEWLQDALSSEPVYVEVYPNGKYLDAPKRYRYIVLVYPMGVIDL